MGVLIFTEAGIKGSVPGDMKLVIDDDQGQAQRLVLFGVHSRNYSADATAALHYECESRTALGGSATAVGPTGASGGGSNVMRQTGLLTTPQAIMSTQASGGGAHLAHVGDFRWWQRLYIPTGNTGTVSVRLEWGEGDYRQTTLNDVVEIPDSARGGWVLVDLGTVNLAKVTAGTQRWEGRVLAASTVMGDDVDLDRFFLAPFTEGYGEVHADWQYRQGTIVGRDEFTGMTAGAVLNGRTAPLGVWATSGTATDFTAADGPDAGEETVSRATTADAAAHLAVMGSSVTDTEAGIWVRWTSASANPTLQLRVRDGAGGYAYLSIRPFAVTAPMSVGHTSGAGAIVLASPALQVNTWYQLRLVAYASGLLVGTLLTAAGATIAEVTLTDAALATGGALASGKAGFADFNSGIAVTRYYDNFYAATPPALPVAIAPSQSLEIRSDRVVREDAGGTLWVDAQFEGFYPRVPVAWLEGRTTRFLVATCRGPKLATGVYADPGLDDLSARLTYTPRTLNLPSA